MLRIWCAGELRSLGKRTLQVCARFTRSYTLCVHCCLTQTLEREGALYYWSLQLLICLHICGKREKRKTQGYLAPGNLK
jgi:hypothetical protein